MSPRISKKRFERIAKYIFVVAALGGIPFLFIHGVWGELLLKIYLLTTFLLLIVFYAYWESTKELWFWKAMIPILLIHSLVIFGLVKLNTQFPEIDRIPGVDYGALTLVLTAEALVSRRFIEAMRPRRAKHPSKTSQF